MGSLSVAHWLIFGLIAVVVLGGGRFSRMMGEVAKGIRQFKQGIAEDDDPVRPLEAGERAQIGARDH